jgi:translation initiation factor 2 beta subunit (eIF-2beta)/eIF-5
MENTEKMETILAMVINRYNTQYDDGQKINEEGVKGRSRVARLNKARVMTATIIRNLTKAKLQEIGRFINRDHANVIHLSTVSHDAFYLHDPLYKVVYEDVVSLYLGKVGSMEYVLYDVRSYIQKILKLELEVQGCKNELMSMLNGSVEGESIKAKRQRILTELQNII